MIILGLGFCYWHSNNKYLDVNWLPSTVLIIVHYHRLGFFPIEFFQSKIFQKFGVNQKFVQNNQQVTKKANICPSFVLFCLVVPRRWKKRLCLQSNIHWKTKLNIKKQVQNLIDSEQRNKKILINIIEEEETKKKGGQLTSCSHWPWSPSSE